MLIDACIQEASLSWELWKLPTMLCLQEHRAGQVRHSLTDTSCMSGRQVPNLIEFPWLWVLDSEKMDAFYKNLSVIDKKTTN